MAFTRQQPKLSRAAGTYRSGEAPVANARLVRSVAIQLDLDAADLDDPTMEVRFGIEASDELLGNGWYELLTATTQGGSAVRPGMSRIPTVRLRRSDFTCRRVRTFIVHTRSLTAGVDLDVDTI